MVTTSPCVLAKGFSGIFDQPLASPQVLTGYNGNGVWGQPDCIWAGIQDWLGIDSKLVITGNTAKNSEKKIIFG